MIHYARCILHDLKSFDRNDGCDFAVPRLKVFLECKQSDPILLVSIVRGIVVAYSSDHCGAQIMNLGRPCGAKFDALYFIDSIKVHTRMIDLDIPTCTSPQCIQLTLISDDECHDSGEDQRIICKFTQHIVDTLHHIERTRTVMIRKHNGVKHGLSEVHSRFKLGTYFTYTQTQVSSDIRIGAIITAYVS
jgi:hypothetical protein